MKTKFIGNRFVHNGKIMTAIGETDSGNVKLEHRGEESWTSYDRLQPIDGSTKGFRVFDLPKAA